jgi:hypothetical protein
MSQESLRDTILNQEASEKRTGRENDMSDLIWAIVNYIDILQVRVSKIEKKMREKHD